jgi:phage tail-like protein
MPISVHTLLALTSRFHVSIKDTEKDVDLGGWARCQGLQVKFNPEPIKEGGNYQYEPILQGHIQYPNVTLTRAMNGEDTKKVQEWLAERAKNWIDGLSSGNSGLRRMVHMKGFGGTAKITLYDAHGQEVSNWTLRNVFPAMWKGPDLDASTLGVAIETLELAHEGFL